MGSDMRNTQIIGLILLLCLAAATKAQADAVDDLEKLIAEVKAATPLGWRVEFDHSDFTQRAVRPVLKITSAKKLPVEHLGPGRPPGIEIKHEPVTESLAFMAYLTAEEYQAARDRNDGLIGKRREFVASHLKDVPRSGKGEDPPPPFAFEPRTAAEETTVRRYAFLWLGTEPTQLPTHHYRQLSMWHWPAAIKIHDAQGEREHRQITNALENIITPYEGAAVR
jgi:hypothetical protein